MNTKKTFQISNDTLRNDLPSGLVVFLVALPLCVGIAFASGTPILSGIIAGIVGGIVVSLISNSAFSVSGPAAGLTLLVSNAVLGLNNLHALFAAVVLAGVFQVIFGFLRAGVIGSFFPSSVIKGMLAAIGIILLLKQIPHAIGYDLDYEGDFDFFQWDNKNTFSELIEAFKRITPGAVFISGIGIVILVIWDRYKLSNRLWVHGSIVVVAAGILLNEFFPVIAPFLIISDEHTVQVLPTEGVQALVSQFTFADLRALADTKVIVIALELALVASIETLLAVDAVDRLDPQRRYTDKNRELLAQGAGNIVSGLLGGLPITSVIVRSSANIDAGAKSNMSAFFHGIFMLMAVLIFPGVINKIPLSALAAILLVVAYKLTQVKVFKEQYQKGLETFIPFLVTILAIVFTGLLIGIAIGTAVALFFILRRDVLFPFKFNKQEMNYGVKVKLELAEEVSFLNKSSIVYKLQRTPKNSHLVIDGSKTRYIDPDILEIIEDFKVNASSKNIKVELISVGNKFEILENQELEKIAQQEYEKLFSNNRAWVKERLSHDKNYFSKLAQGQAPKFLFIGCSDSRITANEITGTDAGEMFVHRNIANLVVPTDVNLMSVMQYSVEVLKVKHVIVCGHYGCGGVKAAVDGKYHGLIDTWLGNIKNVYRTHEREMDKILDDDQRHRRLVELVVSEQVFNVCSTPIIQRQWRQGNNVEVHGWVYDISEGYLKDLQIDTRNGFKGFDVYKFDFDSV
ncbi:MAG: SulP family inorganic anion transporter [Cytophagaceae bacterium]|jgi:carbonic anhydrase|nr:SulP family inorganic anion transporter [Cytophagaceae bacterium]